jgi:predicted metal-dependent HD superfamily phosphohydrolase
MKVSDSIENRRIQMISDAYSLRPDEKWVRSEFSRLLNRIRSIDHSVIDNAFDALLQRYQEPTCPGLAQRHYHSFEHVLDLLGWWRMNLFFSFSEMPIVGFMSILYHDCVYRSDGSFHNEAASAGIAVQELFPLILDNNAVSQIASEIMATDHGADRTSRYFVRDYDLVGLARDWSVVESDGERIRQEYANVPDEQFYAGRKKFFEALNNRRIFESSIFQEVFSNQARHNIARIVDDCTKKLLVHK